MAILSLIAILVTRTLSLRAACLVMVSSFFPSLANNWLTYWTGRTIPVSDFCKWPVASADRSLPSQSHFEEKNGHGKKGYTQARPLLAGFVRYRGDGNWPHGAGIEPSWNRLPIWNPKIGRLPIPAVAG
jgi:hypothetical protein